MSAEKIMRLPTGSYRLHRFPPLAQPVKAPDDRLLDDEWQGHAGGYSAAARSRFSARAAAGAMDEGLRQGLEQGKQQGIIDGQKEGFQKGFVSGEQSGKQHFLEAAKTVNELYQTLSRWQAEREQQQASHHL